MATDTVGSDMGIGLGMLFAGLTVAAAVGMVVGGFNQLGAHADAWQVTTAWAFAAAMGAAMVAVVAVQAFWD